MRGMNRSVKRPVRARYFFDKEDSAFSFYMLQNEDKYDKYQGIPS